MSDPRLTVAPGELSYLTKTDFLIAQVSVIRQPNFESLASRPYQATHKCKSLQHLLSLKAYPSQTSSDRPTP